MEKIKMENKFKVGDKVSFSNNMQKGVGLIDELEWDGYVVESKDLELHEYMRSDGKWWFAEDNLELLEDYDDLETPIEELIDVGDIVNKPDHYKMYTQETYDKINELGKYYPSEVMFGVGNIQKYLDRAPFKGKMIEDLKKLIANAERVVETLEECDK